MLISLIMVISQCIHISKHHIVHFRYTQFYFNQSYFNNAGVGVGERTVLSKLSTMAATSPHVATEHLKRPVLSEMCCKYKIHMKFQRFSMNKM